MIEAGAAAIRVTFVAKHYRAAMPACSSGGLQPAVFTTPTRHE
jgi:hypothetical protein